MKKIAVTSTAELRHALAEVDGGALFRGQVAYYEKYGHPSVVTSFDRRGCIPSQMLKWCRYADNVLDTYIRAAGKPLTFSQALLQHYGRRSFYVDCSASAAVAAWFASHVYSERQTIELCEDCEERPVMLVKRRPTLDSSSTEGKSWRLRIKRRGNIIAHTSAILRRWNTSGLLNGRKQCRSRTY